MSSFTGSPASAHPEDGRQRPQRPATCVALRWAKRTDLEVIANLDREVFPKMPYPLFVLRQYLDTRPESILLVIEEDGVVCGYVLATVVSSEKKAWLLGLAVSAQCRGRHYGDQLLGRVLQLCRDQGVRRVLITVRPNNDAALGLYRKYNFHKTSSEDNYYGDLEPREIMHSVLPRNALRTRVGRPLSQVFDPKTSSPGSNEPGS